MNDTPKKPRGFAALTPEQRSAISRKGGIAAHQQGTAHEFTKETARVAGAKGGKRTREKYTREERSRFQKP